MELDGNIQIGARRTHQTGEAFWYTLCTIEWCMSLMYTLYIIDIHIDMYVCRLSCQYNRTYIHDCPYACMSDYIHTYIRTSDLYIHTYIRCLSDYVHTYIRICKYTYVCKYVSNRILRLRLRSEMRWDDIFILDRARYIEIDWYLL